MRTSVSGTEMESSTSTAAAVISAQSTAVWPACGWTIWRSSMWAVPAAERAAPFHLRNWSRSMSRTWGQTSPQISANRLVFELCLSPTTIIRPHRVAS